MIRFENLQKEFRWKKDSVEALKDINLTIEDGEIYGIIGFSGAGKSTLIRVINGLEKPTSGKVYVGDKELGGLSKSQLREIRKRMGMVFQQFNLLNSKTVYDNIAMPLILNKENKAVIDQRVKELLSFVELSDKENAYPSQLSGGQKQRVGIARALATNPSILLCDEATSALDPKTTDAILDLLKKINRNLGITIVIITHEMHVIQKICDCVAVMEDGRIIEKGKVKDVFADPQENITKDFVGMVIREDIPDVVLKGMDIHKDAQIWSIKYWGENRTLEIVDMLREKAGAEVKLIYSTTNSLRNSVLNVLIIEICDKKDKTDEMKAALKPYAVLLERKHYEH